MRRREFITLFGSAAVTQPFAARAQQSTIPVIGYLSGWSPGDAPEYLNYFRQGLAEAGYVEGRNVAIEYRYAAGRVEKVAELADELVRRQVDVIAVPNTTQSVIVAKGGDTNHSDSLFARIQSG
jgi:putative tryptophan/tyrosine transport system substrate-binding protein